MVDWQALIPTVYYQAGAAVSGSYNLATTVTINSGTTTAYDIQVEAPISTVSNSLIDIDNVVIVNGSSQTVSNIDTSAEINTASSIAKDVPVSMIHIERISNDTDVKLEYLVSSTITSIKDVDIELKLYIAPSTTRWDTTVDVTISNDQRFTFDVDIFSTKLAEVLSFETDVDITTGVVHNVVSDIFNSVLTVVGIESDTFSTTQAREYFGLEATVISGAISLTRGDIFSTALGTEGIELDVRTWSLFTTNFFLDQWSFTEATEAAWVDVVDYMWDIDTDNTYFMVDDVAVSGTTFSGISNGYRCFYNPPSDYLHDGPFTYTIHAQNIKGDILEQDYNLLYGFDVDFNRIVEWGPQKKIDILTKAANKAYCSNTAAEGFYFVTRDFSAINLGSSVLPVAPVDLGSTINTQAKAFYYGGTYQVTVSGIRDYAGNELAPIVYSFTIENPIG